MAGQTAISRRTAVLQIAVIWLLSAAYGILGIYFYDNVATCHLRGDVWRTEKHCDVPRTKTSTYQTVVLVRFLFCYVTPLATMSVLYHRIMTSLYREQKTSSISGASQYRRNWRVMRMLITVVAAFTILQLPQHVYRIHTHWVGVFRGHLIVLDVCELVLYTTSWLNVLIYVLLNHNFRKVIRRAILTNRHMLFVINKVAPCVAMADTRIDTISIDPLKSIATTLRVAPTVDLSRTAKTNDVRNMYM